MSDSMKKIFENMDKMIGGKELTEGTISASVLSMLTQAMLNAPKVTRIMEKYEVEADLAALEGALTAALKSFFVGEGFSVSGASDTGKELRAMSKMKKGKKKA